MVHSEKFANTAGKRPILQKPYLNAAAVRQPDGRWSLGVVNLTGVTEQSVHAKFHPATECQVTWTVPALADRDEINFEVYRSSVDKRFESAGRAVMQRGQITIVVPPRELVTLLSVKWDGLKKAQ